MPAAVDRATFEAELDRLRVREKAHTREGDAIAAARRRLPMVEVDANLALIEPQGPLTLLDAFEGRRQLIAHYFMWFPGRPAAEQCEGCTWCTSQVAELSYLHSRDITYAVLCQGQRYPTAPVGDSSRMSRSRRAIRGAQFTAGELRGMWEMASRGETEVRVAAAADAATFGRLLHAFNVEFDEETPDPNVIAERAVPLIDSGEVLVLFVRDAPDGFAQLRFRPSVHSAARDACLEVPLCRVSLLTGTSLAISFARRWGDAALSDMVAVVHA